MLIVRITGEFYFLLYRSSNWTWIILIKNINCIVVVRAARLYKFTKNSNLFIKYINFMICKLYFRDYSLPPSLPLSHRHTILIKKVRGRKKSSSLKERKKLQTCYVLFNEEEGKIKYFWCLSTIKLHDYNKISM